MCNLPVWVLFLAFSWHLLSLTLIPLPPLTSRRLALILSSSDLSCVLVSPLSCTSSVTCSLLVVRDFLYTLLRRAPFHFSQAYSHFPLNFSHIKLFSSSSIPLSSSISSCHFLLVMWGCVYSVFLRLASSYLSWFFLACFNFLHADFSRSTVLPLISSLSHLLHFLLFLSEALTHSTGSLFQRYNVRLPMLCVPPYHSFTYFLSLLLTLSLPCDTTITTTVCTTSHNGKIYTIHSILSRFRVTVLPAATRSRVDYRRCPAARLARPSFSLKPRGEAGSVHWDPKPTRRVFF